MIKQGLVIISIFLFGFVISQIIFVFKLTNLNLNQKTFFDLTKFSQSIPSSTINNQFYTREKKFPLISDKAIEHFKTAEIPWMESLKQGNNQSLILNYQIDGYLSEAYIDILKNAFVITIADKKGTKLIHYRLKNNEKNQANFLFYDKSPNKIIKINELKVGSKVHFTETWDITKYPILFSYKLIQL